MKIVTTQLLNPIPYTTECTFPYVSRVSNISNEIFVFFLKQTVKFNKTTAEDTIFTVLLIISDDKYLRSNVLSNGAHVHRYQHL